MSSVQDFDFSKLTDPQLVRWATTYGAWHYFNCNDQLRDPRGGMTTAQNWANIGSGRRNEIIDTMKKTATKTQLFHIGALKPIWIKVDDGEMFEGHQGHWADCFFSNSYQSAIEASFEEGQEFSMYKLEIREMTDTEIKEFPEVIQFRKQLMEQYGEV